MDAAPQLGTQLTARARELVPQLAAVAPATEMARDVPAETIAAFHRAGILSALQPRRFGGAQQDFGVFSEIVETLAEGCAASAWVYAVLGEHQWIIACMPEKAQEDVWGANPRTCASSSLAPRESAQRVAGGWRLSGRFPFSSGSAYAQWAIVGAKCDDGAIRYLLVPMQHVEIIDDWHVLGLRGTGSRSLKLDGVYIPAHRSVLFSDLMNGTPPGRDVHPDYDLLRAPRGFLVPFSLPVVAFAVGERALRAAASALAGRLSRGMTQVAQSEYVQVQLGEAAAAIETAALIMRMRRRESLAELESGAPIAAVRIERNRRDVTFALRQMRDAVRSLFELCGARAVYDADPLQILLRDVQTIATHHVVNPAMAYGAYGRLLLGTGSGRNEA